MRYGSGLLVNQQVDWDEIVVLVHTPGVPHEWVYAAAGLTRHYRRLLKSKIDAVDAVERLKELALENARSIEAEDGWQMLLAVCPNYSGPASLYSQLFLQNSMRSDGENAALLGVSRDKVRRWRVNPVFDPLTAVRLVDIRGGATSPLRADFEVTMSLAG